MNTIFISYINSISFTVSKDYDFDDNEFKTIVMNLASIKIYLMKK